MALRVVDGCSESGPPTVDQAFRAHAPYVAAIALRLLGRPDEVEDVVQDVFLQAIRGLETIRHLEALKGWLASVTVHVALRRLRKRRLYLLLGLDMSYDYSTALAPGLSPEDRSFLAEVCRLLDRQPARRRLAWSLRYLHGEPLDRVAELCECSVATAKRWIAGVHAKILAECGDE